MPTYKIRGINVDFPFEAYDCQIDYMEKVIQSLQQRSNALLESPTGTGKTLCLLCATLAWRKSLGGFTTGRAGSKLGQEWASESESKKLPTIVYASRTHSQLRQVVKELKRTNYRPKMVVLGSREQLCIHEDVSLLRGRAQNNACHSLCRKKKKRFCAHFTRVAEFMKTNPGLGDEPIDIEDLVNIGKSCGPCPYYMSRELHKVVDILFAPYNYLIDNGNRKSLNIEWENSIIIFDEAHNLEGLCADAASFDLPSGLLTACISEAQRCIELSTVRRDNSNDTTCKPETFAILKALLKKLETRIAEVPIEFKELGFTKPGPYIYELLGGLNITGETAAMLNCTIEEAVLLLEEGSNDSEMGNNTNRTACRLETMGNILKIIFKDGGNDHARHYRVHIQEIESSGSDAFRSSKTSRIFSWWCFNPGIAMEGFSKLGVGSIILTSGTLSPMDSFAEELKLDFPIRLENPHVISSNQLWSGIVPVGPSGFPFNSSYRTRDSPEYKQELGNAIVNFARIVPDGLLVFFPSYFLLDQCIGYWKDMGNASTANSSTIWERICKHKLPVVEPRQSSLFNVSIDDYMTKLKDTKASGAIFFAVCRGKVSEGLDFADQAGRAVIVTGIPFATRTDPKVRLKREFLDQQALSQGKGCKVLTGEEWYSQQASRAVNQAVGRVIRHRHDYGAIIFCDERFTNSNRQSQISRWIHPHIQCYSMFGDVVYTLTRFFRDGGIRGPTKLELEQTDDQGNTNPQDSFNPLEKLHLEKFLAPLKTEFNSTYSVDSSSSSSLVEVMRGSKALNEILPANQSSLNFHKGSQILSTKHSSDKFTCDKRTVIPPKRNVQCSKNTFVNLTSDTSSDEKESKELIAPCSVKKPRLLKTGSDLAQKFENPEKRPVVKIEPLSTPYSCIDSVKRERPHITVCGSTQNAEAGKNDLHGNALTAQKSSAECFSQKNKGVLSSTVAGEDEEKKGATFLTQVKEKLSEPEYKNFVGFMKAMRSKAMKTGFVLQSIVRLFSTPDRLPLLQRFKDYVPAKYQSLYENYAKGNGNDDDSDAIDHLKQLTGKT